MREIKIQVWDPEIKVMSVGMPLPMLAGFLMAIYPNLGKEIYREWTGLKDKNGVEIYEGDILKTLAGTKGEVKFENFQWTFYSTALSNWGGSKGLKVIGNIYQNPEFRK